VLSLILNSIFNCGAFVHLHTFRNVVQQRIWITFHLAELMKFPAYNDGSQWRIRRDPWFARN